MLIQWNLWSASKNSVCVQWVPFQGWLAYAGRGGTAVGVTSVTRGFLTMPWIQISASCFPTRHLGKGSGLRPGQGRLPQTPAAGCPAGVGEAGSSDSPRLTHSPRGWQLASSRPAGGPRVSSLTTGTMSNAMSPRPTPSVGQRGPIPALLKDHWLWEVQGPLVPVLLGVPDILPFYLP